MSIITALAARRGRRVLRICAAVLFAGALAPHPADAQWVYIGSDRIMRVNGSRFFPVGLLEIGADRYPDDWNQRIRDSGANCVWDNGFAYVDSMPSCSAIRDSSLAAGYYVLTGSPDTWEWDDPQTPELEVDQPMFDAGPLGDLDSCFPGFTSHLGYTNRDEPIWTTSRNQVGDIDSLHIHDTYDQLKVQDGFKVVAMNFASTHLSQDVETWKQDILSMVGATDVVMTASYPYPPGPGTCSEYNALGYPDCDMDRLWRAADIYVEELIQPGQAFWMILQGFKLIPLQEARWQATQAIIHGATGLLWAGWAWYHPLGTGEETWPVTKQVVGEFEALANVLVQSDRSGYAADVEDVDVRAKSDPGGEAVIFAASKNGFSGSAAISVPGGVNSDWVEVLYEGRYLEITGDSFADAFGGLVSSHVYRVMPPGFVPAATGVETSLPESAEGFRLRVFPNPARGTVTATFATPATGVVTVDVFDVTGRRLGAVSIRETGPGTGIAEWVARDAEGHRVPPGVYFLRGTAPDGASATERVVLR